jgi:hypothetical protein
LLASQSEPPLEADASQIKTLIARLGSERFQARVKAEKRLDELGEAALAALKEAAAKAEDLEVRSRASKLVHRIVARVEEREWQKFVSEHGIAPLDRLIEEIAKDPARDDENAWKMVKTLGNLITKRAGELGGREWAVEKFDVAALPFRRDLTTGLLGRIALDTPSKTINLISSIAIRNGPLGRTSVNDSWVFVNGDIEELTGIWNSLIVCRGNIGKSVTIRDSIVLCTGQIEGLTFAERSFVEAKSIGAGKLGRNCVFVNVPPYPSFFKDSHFTQSKQSPLRLLQPLGHEKNAVR